MKTGRPPRPIDWTAVDALRAQKLTFTEIARRLNISRNTLARRKAAPRPEQSLPAKPTLPKTRRRPYVFAEKEIGPLPALDWPEAERRFHAELPGLPSWPDNWQYALLVHNLLTDAAEQEQISLSAHDRRTKLINAARTLKHSFDLGFLYPGFIRISVWTRSGITKHVVPRHSKLLPIGPSSPALFACFPPL